MFIQKKQVIEGLLSAREFEVLEHIARGYKNREIAAALAIQEVTVRFHVGNIFDKLGVKNRAEAVGYAFRHKLITD